MRGYSGQRLPGQPWGLTAPGKDRSGDGRRRGFQLLEMHVAWGVVCHGPAREESQAGSQGDGMTQGLVTVVRKATGGGDSPGIGHSRKPLGRPPSIWSWMGRVRDVTRISDGTRTAWQQGD